MKRFLAGAAISALIITAFVIGATHAFPPHAGLQWLGGLMAAIAR